MDALGRQLRPTCPHLGRPSVTEGLLNPLAERILVMTQKPTRIKEEVKVNLPRPRNYADPKFAEIRRYVTELVKWW